jgi:hypothetical protein
LLPARVGPGEKRFDLRSEREESLVEAFDECFAVWRDQVKTLFEDTDL